MATRPAARPGPRSSSSSRGAEMKTKTTTKKSSRKKTASKAAPKKATTPKAEQPAHKNLDIYGAKPIPWSRALKELSSSTTGQYWLATTRPDGRPHVAGVGALWVDGKIYFGVVAPNRTSGICATRYALLAR